MISFGPLEAAQLEQSASDPASFNVIGRIYYNSGDFTTRVYNGSDYKSLVVTDLSQTLTNKTIDSDSNTITNIVNADVKAAAGIVYSKLTLTDGILNADINSAAAIAYSKLNLSGGIVNADVNASAAIAYSKLNLATSIVNADVSASAAIVYSKLSITNGVVFGDLSSTSCTIDEDSMVTDSAVRIPTQQSVKAYVDTQIATVTTAADSILDMQNLALSTSVASNILTIALKTKAGSDPSVGSPVSVGMRNSTLTTGTYNIRTATAALSMDVSSGATLGHVSGAAEYIYVYLIDNASALELACSSTLFDTGGVVTTTTMSNAADSGLVMYSTTGRSNVPVKLVGRILITEATAGTWASNATEIVPGNEFAISKSPTGMSNQEASRIGCKSYLGDGTTYNGGVAPSITTNRASTSLKGASLIPYQTQDGSWRLKIDIVVEYTASTSMVITINATTFKNATNYYQALAYTGFAGGAEQAYCNPGAGTINTDATVSSGRAAVNGDVELDSKPSWVY